MYRTDRLDEVAALIWRAQDFRRDLQKAPHIGGPDVGDAVLEYGGGIADAISALRGGASRIDAYEELSRALVWLAFLAGGGEESDPAVMSRISEFMADMALGKPGQDRIDLDWVLKLLATPQLDIYWAIATIIVGLQAVGFDVLGTAHSYLDSLDGKTKPQND